MSDTNCKIRNVSEPLEGCVHLYIINNTFFISWHDESAEKKAIPNAIFVNTSSPTHHLNIYPKHTHPVRISAVLQKCMFELEGM